MCGRAPGAEASRERVAANGAAATPQRGCRVGGAAPWGRGAVIGETNDNGTAVTDREVDHGHLFHTLLAAVGVDSKSEFDIGGRKFPIADPAKGPIKELLA